MKSIATIPLNKAHWFKLRSSNLNSTEISALFGLNPYLTLFELWHRKKDLIKVEDSGNERTRWGTRLEESIARGIAEDQNWDIRAMKEYMSIPDLRMGSSFDFAIGQDGLLEVKNVDALIFRDGWLKSDDGEIEAPAHIEMQVQIQMFVAERSFDYIGCLVGGNQVSLLKREPDDKVIKAVLKKVQWFWESIETNKAPEPDFSRDADTIRALYSQASQGKVLDLIGDQTTKELARRYKGLIEAKKGIESELDEVKSKLLMQAGDAEKVLGENFSLSLGVVKGGHVEYDRADYRQFRINWKKEVKS